MGMVEPRDTGVWGTEGRTTAGARCVPLVMHPVHGVDGGAPIRGRGFPPRPAGAVPGSDGEGELSSPTAVGPLPRPPEKVATVALCMLALWKMGGWERKMGI